ncbi:MAG: hypothetical protein H7844_14590 [Nitrospirae bacterium YQR-1]
MNETIIETEKPPEITDQQGYIDRIDDTLRSLSLERLKEVSDFAAYLADKERRHREFVEETLAAAANPERIMFKDSTSLIKAALETVSENP